jgi:hypothetical protein
MALKAAFAEHNAGEMILPKTVYSAGLGVKLQGIGDRRHAWLPLYDIDNPRVGEPDHLRHPCSAKVFCRRGLWLAEVTLHKLPQIAL